MERGDSDPRAAALSSPPPQPTIDKLIAKAKAAGATSVMVEGVEMRFGEPAVEQTNDLDKWMAKRHAH
jgi:hypothetical protein